MAHLVDYFSDWSTGQFLARAFIAGAAAMVMCAVLSVLVVLKRLAFVGQGVSHSAFGGIGVASLVAALSGVAWLAADAPGGFLIIVLFCVATALGMGSVDDRTGGRGSAVRVDAGIGLFLVASMALGGLLVQIAHNVSARHAQVVAPRSWESLLFGSVLDVSWTDTWGVLALLGIVVGLLWWFRRPMLFYAFDEPSAIAFGVPTRAMRTLMMVLIAIATVAAMELVGVVLATAMLILPGAIALKLSRRLRTVMMLACTVGLAALALGLMACLATDVPAGPCIVLALVAAFAAAALKDKLAPAASSRDAARVAPPLAPMVASPPKGSP